MSQENVEVVRSYVDLLRDYEWDRLADLLSDDLVYRPVPEITEAEQYIGPQAFRHFAEEFQRGEWLKNFDQKVTITAMATAALADAIKRLYISGPLWTGLR